ncbi:MULTISPECIES: replication endonuclease [Yersinia]|uniref:replication endonuclease n=1 Tax=Yersinia TaxID=629 RepID=UPI0009B6FB62|nr:MULTISPECIES: replication endonuclease [Yersinia]ARB85395.1 replication endonuclease [Yersinia sp. FDAARGOS_228]AVL35214.1 replication endonuclease [Yersinia intermedia]
MTSVNRGRFAPSPPPPFTVSCRETFVGAYPWNAPRKAIGRERQLTREEYLQGQAVLNKINSLPYFLRSLFISRHANLQKHQGQLAANKYLALNFMQLIWPRIQTVNQKHGLKHDIALGFLSEEETYLSLPGMNDKELVRFAGRISAQLFSAYEELSDTYIAEHNGDKTALFNDSAQTKLYGHIAGMARSLNVTPLHWRKYRKGKLTMRHAFSAIARLVNDEWWTRQLKALRIRWREALLIAVGEVNRHKSGYASKQAIKDIQSRRLSNMEFLKGCELENVDTGERIDLIDKVLASISNPEIRRMELMNTIAGIEKYAANMQHVGMFITITTPSKYHPTRVVENSEKEKVLFNHKWDKEAFTPKDGQRYLCKIWSKMRTAFKDNDLKVYGMRVVEPHHDGTPHWHMMLFCERQQRRQVIDIMRRYSLMEDGDERGAEKNRFECKHLKKGGAAGYIAKYIAKNIDGYALDGELDHETGQPLTETATAVTAWAATWRIPQFHPIGVPTMGAYRECRRIRGLSLAESFDDQVEAVRAAADAADFAAYITQQGGANVPRDQQTIRVARKVAEELNAYDEEVQKVIGIYAPHLGESKIYETRSTQWRIVAKAVDVELLTLKSASGAPRSSVNNCGLAAEVTTIEPKKLPPESIYSPVNTPIDWDDEGNVLLIKSILRGQTPTINHKQRPYDPYHCREAAPSARLTQEERARLPKIRAELTAKGIQPTRWELEALTRGAKIHFGDLVFHYPRLDTWGDMTKDL